MSKVSVFRFSMQQTDTFAQSIINQIIGEYLSKRGFYYNQMLNCYMTGQPNPSQTGKDIAMSIGTSVVASVITGGAVGVALNRVEHGFEYSFAGNELIIKAYIITRNGKQFIHSTFNNSQAASVYYGDLKRNLFDRLKEHNVVLTKKEIEKINDGSEAKALKLLLIIISIMIISAVLLISLLAI